MKQLILIWNIAGWICKSQHHWYFRINQIEKCSMWSKWAENIGMTIALIWGPWILSCGPWVVGPHHIVLYLAFKKKEKNDNSKKAGYSILSISWYDFFKRILHKSALLDYSSYKSPKSWTKIEVTIQFKQKRYQPDLVSSSYVWFVLRESMDNNIFIS